MTIDDLPLNTVANLPPDQARKITERLLDGLQQTGIPAIGFVNEGKLYRDGNRVADRVGLLEQWLDRGFELGNHSYSHPSLHRTPLPDYLDDVRRGETVTRELLADRGLAIRFFRHPFLHTGTDLATRDAVVTDLESRNIRIAPVTIDNSEWIYARAYDIAVEKGEQDLIERVATSYVEYMIDMFAYYEQQSEALFGRTIPHVLLLHANRLNADRIVPLAAAIQARGYQFIDLDQALADPAYDSADRYAGPGGITWIHRWALTQGKRGAFFAGEPRCPDFIQELAGIRE